MTSVLVNTVELCQLAVDQCLRETEIAVDIEGDNLSRIGSIALIQIFNQTTGAVYLFDIHVLKHAAFDEGGLKDLFQEPQITKLFFDVRADVDALYHIYDVKVASIYDMQVLYHIKFVTEGDQFLKGLHKVLDYFASETCDGSDTLSPAERCSLKMVKEEGKKLFVPELGGSYAAWTVRPLSPLLIKYAAADVKYLMAMKLQWGGHAVAPARCGAFARSLTLDQNVKLISSERAKRFVDKPEVTKQEEKKKLDFVVPTGFNRTGNVTKEIHVPAHRKGLVIGKKGATVKRIQLTSGANIHLEGDKATVIGKPHEVEFAILQIQTKIGGLDVPLSPTDLPAAAALARGGAGVTAAGFGYSTSTPVTMDSYGNALQQPGKYAPYGEEDTRMHGSMEKAMFWDTITCAEDAHKIV